MWSIVSSCSFIFVFVHNYWKGHVQHENINGGNVHYINIQRQGRFEQQGGHEEQQEGYEQWEGYEQQQERYGEQQVDVDEANDRRLLIPNEANPPHIYDAPFPEW